MAQAGFQIRFATVARIAVAIAIAGKALEPACCAGTEGRRVGAVRTYIAALLTMARIGIETVSYTHLTLPTTYPV